MKCPNCKFYNICKGRLNETVENCVRFKSAEQTNEEWLRSCTKDELVKTILDLCDYRPCFACGCGIGYCDDENWCHVYSDEAREFVLEWLKQPHTTE